MPWIRRSSKWPILGIVGYFGDKHPPITAAVDINLQTPDELIVPGVIPPPVNPCARFASWDILLVLDGITACMCSPSGGGSQVPDVSPNGPYAMVVSSPGDWQSAGPSYSVDLFSDPDCTIGTTTRTGSFQIILTCVVVSGEPQFVLNIVDLDNSYVIYSQDMGTPLLMNGAAVPSTIGGGSCGDSVIAFGGTASLIGTPP